MVRARLRCMGVRPCLAVQVSRRQARLGSIEAIPARIVEPESMVLRPSSYEHVADRAMRRGTNGILNIWAILTMLM